MKRYSYSKIKKLKNEINNELIVQVALLLQNITCKNINVCKIDVNISKKSKLKKNPLNFRAESIEIVPLY